MSPTLLDAILAFFLALSSPVAAPEGEEMPPVPVPPVQTMRHAVATCALHTAPASDRIGATLIAGPQTIRGEVTFAFELRQETNRVRQRIIDTVALAPGETLHRDIAMSVNGRVTPAVTVTLPDGGSVRCR